MQSHISVRKYAFAALFSLCAGAAFAGGTFVTALPSAPITLDPALMYDRYSVMLALNIYEPLVAFGGKSYRADFAPFLSAKVPSRKNGLISKDGRTYTFPIRTDIKFHDGAKLSAENVRYSLMRVIFTGFNDGPASLFLRPLLGLGEAQEQYCPLPPSYKDVAAAIKTDGNNLVITLEHPYPPLLSLLASWPFVTSKAWAVAHGDWDGTEATLASYRNRPREKSALRMQADGTGPFKLESMDADTGRVVMARNDAYWRGPAKLEKLIFDVVPSETNRQSMLEAGDIDYAEFDRTSVPDLEHMKGVAVQDNLPDYAVGQFLAFNFDVDAASNPFVGSGALDGNGIPHDFFSDPDVRKGFAYAFDYDKYFHGALRAKAHRLTSAVPRPDAPKTPPFTYDPKKAGEYFRKAFGGKLWDKGFTFVAVYSIGRREGQYAMDMLAEGLKKINPAFNMRLHGLHEPELMEMARQHRLPIFSRSFEPDYPDYYNMAFHMMHSAGMIPGYQHYHNAEVDRLCDKTLYTEGPERAAAFAALDKMYADDAAGILLFSPDYFKAYREGVTGVDTPPGVFEMHNFLDYYRVDKK